jgi:hypothetical protein
MPLTMRLAYSLLCVSVIMASGCRGRSISTNPDGGMDPCSAIPVDKCSQYAGCELIVPCACPDNPGSMVCVTKGTVYECGACLDCTHLTEAECKQNSLCRADYCSACGCGTPSFAGCASVGAPPTLCPLKCPAGICCDGLDETACKANSSCTANYCVGCNGVKSFSGCSGPGGPAPTCNTSCGCRGQADCSNSGGGLCVAPGGSVCGGACPMGCTSDSQCSSGFVCDPAPCACGAANKACIPSCVTNGCATGESCGSDGHCAPMSCATAANCPAFFDCVVPQGGASRCERRACADDTACAGGYCVDGGCYAMLGSCQFPPP